MEKKTEQENSNSGNQSNHSLDDEIQRVIPKDEGIPDDKYFKKIWNSIEARAPVGEKYYLRSFFSVFLFLTLMVIFILFYSDFLSSILSLKEIRQQNAQFYSTPSSTLSLPISSPKDYKNVELSKGVWISSLNQSKLQYKDDSGKKIIDFYSGHVLLNKENVLGVLEIHLPDLKLVINQGKCNIFCYDQMIRIIPLTHNIELIYLNKKSILHPGEIFFLLNQEPKILKKK